MLKVKQNLIKLLFSEKLQTEEEKHKISEEKFLKMKTCYGQIRDEHVQLLRKVILISKVLNYICFDAF